MNIALMHYHIRLNKPTQIIIPVKPSVKSPINNDTKQKSSKK